MSASLAELNLTRDASYFMDLDLREAAAEAGWGSNAQLRIFRIDGAAVDSYDFSQIGFALGPSGSYRWTFVHLKPAYGGIGSLLSCRGPSSDWWEGEGSVTRQLVVRLMRENHPTVRGAARCLTSERHAQPLPRHELGFRRGLLTAGLSQRTIHGNRGFRRIARNR